MPEYREEPDGSVKKQCSRCKEWRRPEGFLLSARSSDGLSSQCRACNTQSRVRAFEKLTADARRLRLRSNAKSNYKNNPSGSAKYFRKLAGED